MPARALPSIAAGLLPVLAMALSGAPELAADWSAWHARRIERLRAPDGWLALVGLHWLSEGANRIEGLPGVFMLAGGKVTLTAAAADGYVLEDVPVTARALVSDAAGRPDRLRLGTRTIAVIERGPRYALRVWDARSPVLAGFRGVDAFPPDPRWRIEARWEAYPTPRTVEVPSVVGIPTQERVPGRAHFTVNGKALSLEPTVDGDALFFVFRDETARRETYGAGRFLSAAAPKDGKVILDFNRATNPPCAFTPYATCPLPLPQNVLPVRIEAGEKRFGGH